MKTEQDLQWAIEEIKRTKFEAHIMEAVGSVKQAVVSQIIPVVQAVASKANISKEELLQALSRINVTVPEIKLPPINITVPDVHVPEIQVPKVSYTPPPVTVNYTPPEVKVDVPKLPKFPAVKVPKPEVTVNVPPLEFPSLINQKFDEFQMKKVGSKVTTVDYFNEGKKVFSLIPRYDGKEIIGMSRKIWS